MPKHKTSLKLLKYDDKFDSFNKGDVVFHEGDEGSSMYVIKAGQVELRVAGVIIDTLEPGDIMGEMALLDGERRSATALCRTETQLVPIDKERFQFMVRQTPYFAIEVMQIMAERLRRMNRNTAVIVKAPVR